MRVVWHRSVLAWGPIWPSTLSTSLSKSFMFGAGVMPGPGKRAHRLMADFSNDMHVTGLVGVVAGAGQGPHKYRARHRHTAAGDMKHIWQRSFAL